MASWTGASGAGTRHSLSRTSNEARGAPSKKKGGGSGGAGVPVANFSSADGRQVQVTASGKEVNSSSLNTPNFSDKNRGPVYVSPPSGGARSSGGGGGRNIASSDANFSSAGGGSVYVPPPVAPRGAARDYQGRSSADFSEGIRRAQPVSELPVTARRGAAEVVVRSAEVRISRVHQAVGGASDVFGWVPGLGGDSTVGKFGRSALGAPFTLATAPAVGVYEGAVKVRTAREVASILPEAVPSIKAESNRALRGTPGAVGTMTRDLFTTPEGLGTVVGGGLLLGGLNTGKKSAPQVMPTSPVKARFVGTVRGTTEGNVVAPPVAPRGTLTMTYKGRPSGIVNAIRGREASVNVRIGPRGDVSRVVTIGPREFRTSQRAGASYSTTRVFKDGRAVGAFEGKPLDIGGARSRVNVVAQETKATAKNVQHDVLVQGVRAGRLVEVEVPVSGGVLKGSFVQESRGGALSRVERGRGSVTGLNLETEPFLRRASFKEGRSMVEILEPGTRTRIVGEPFFKERSLRESLRVGSPEEIARFERRSSENRLSIGKNELIVDERGVRRPSQLGIVAKERGVVRSSFEYNVATEGTFAFSKAPGVFSRLRSRVLGSIARDVAAEEAAGAAARSAANRDWARVVRERPVDWTVFPRASRSAKRSRPADVVTSAGDSGSRRADIAGLADLRKLENLGVGSRARGGRSLNVDPETGLPEFALREGGRQVLEPPRVRSRSSPGRSEFAPLEQSARPVGRAQPVFAQELFRDVRVRGRTARALYTTPVVSQRAGPSFIAGPVSSVVPKADVVPDQIVKPGIVETPAELFTPPTTQQFRPLQPFVPGEPFSPIPEGVPTDFFPPPFALPFGGGGSFGFPSGNQGRQRFKNMYSPSITGGLFNVKGSRKQANVATITGLGVRPLVR